MSYLNMVCHGRFCGLGMRRNLDVCGDVEKTCILGAWVLGFVLLVWYDEVLLVVMDVHLLWREEEKFGGGGGDRENERTERCAI